jgi:hypothetical protein
VLIAFNKPHLIPRQLLGLDGFDPASDLARASRKDD